LAESYKHGMDSGVDTAHSLRQGVSTREAANSLAAFFEDPATILPREFE